MNICVDDGLHLKFVLSTENRLKKVYVGNYYEARLNSIALILNSYLKRTKNCLVRFPMAERTRKQFAKKLNLKTTVRVHRMA